MRYKLLSIILKAVVLAISWLTLSPLLLILDGRWKLLPKWLRIVLFVLSPMTMIVFAAVLVACYLFYCDHFRVRYFVRPRVIENITGVRLPKYKIVEDGETWMSIPLKMCDAIIAGKNRLCCLSIARLCGLGKTYVAETSRCCTALIATGSYTMNGV